jgi:predicted transcriptional regulator
LNGTGEDKIDLTALTADIVAAFVSKNAVPIVDLPRLISETHQTLKGLAAPSLPAVETVKPAVPIRRSITPDYLVSLEDGKQYRTLKRHLSRLGLSPDEYRAKWGLPRDYPMVAPAYSARRSELAKTIGLGRKPATAPIPAAPARKAKSATRSRKTA